MVLLDDFEQMAASLLFGYHNLKQQTKMITSNQTIRRTTIIEKETTDNNNAKQATM
ncbi:hypothetical protein BVRB_6g148420 [Beta vulgaris subsp. vulgaris]|nr:hypothetical protein BVRB_6g148420 [Beta vulgaris subsp. vulgaris]